VRSRANAARGCDDGEIRLGRSKDPQALAFFDAILSTER
jgi:hypothetical protein